MEAINITSIITIAFLGSFGHCVGMCGGIVIAYSSAKIDNSFSKIYQSFAHLTYSFGRVTTYTILGVIFGYVGGVIALTNFTNAILLYIAGFAMILTALSLIGKLKFLHFVEHSLSTQPWYQTLFRNQLDKRTFSSFYILGMLNGLLPCGFVYFFAITAASTASAFWGGVVMFIFGLSTIPALFSVGYFVGVLKNTSFRLILVKLASLSVFVYGIYTIHLGYLYMTEPNRTVQQCHTTSSS